MPRLLLLLTIILFAASNVVAAPLAVCRHADANAHTAAMESSDSGIAATAHGEDAAATAANKQRAMSDAAAASLVGVPPPAQPALPAHFDTQSPPERAANDSRLPNRAIPPLLEPPSV